VDPAPIISAVNAKFGSVSKETAGNSITTPKRQSLDRTASIRLKRAFVYIFGPLIMIDSAN
jgi:hypothetical protein